MPLEELAGISFEQGKKEGRLRLRLRDGADPLLQATGGRLTEPHDPYQLIVESDRYGVGEYFVDEVRNALLLDQVPSGPVDVICCRARPSAVGVRRGRRGELRRRGDCLEWKWKAEDVKSAAGARRSPWRTSSRWSGSRRSPGERPSALHRAGAAEQGAGQVRPERGGAVGLQEGPADGAGRRGRPGPAAPPGSGAAGAPPWGRPAAPGRAAPAGPAPAAEDDHDALLRQLRELGELHRSGVLTDEEFALAKARAVLKRM
ncbi:Tat pathway signal sequence domain protein OS=Streptomyces griseomycini OX=66895 GN=FHS37_005079 PE=4 SV=1 [Streptomyces griseomycini]